MEELMLIKELIRKTIPMQGFRIENVITSLREPLLIKIFIEIQGLEKNSLRFKGYCFFRNAVVRLKGSY
jgi:hypothetical protein